MAEEPRKFMLEITMDANGTRGHKYIKHSFPVAEGIIDLTPYGYPYERYRQIEIRKYDQHMQHPKWGYDHITHLTVVFDGEEINVELNSFATVKRNHYDADIDPYLKVPKNFRNDEIYTTFYLYIA